MVPRSACLRLYDMMPPHVKSIVATAIACILFEQVERFGGRMLKRTKLEDAQGRLNVEFAQASATQQGCSCSRSHSSRLVTRRKKALSANDNCDFYLLGC